jgi:type IV secretory pathway VirB6-like protein
LDDLTFINSNILEDKYFGKIFGTSSSNGILLIANSLLIGYVLYYSVKYLTSNLTYSKIENPVQFIFKLILFGIAMNGSYFIIGQILDINFGISNAIKSIGEDLFKQSISFSKLIESINSNLSVAEESFNIFSVEGIIKGTTTISLVNLITIYAVRYITIKILILISPFAILSLALENTSVFFKLWIRNLLSMLFIQIIVSIIILILCSVDYNSNDLMTKFIYIGGIYCLLKASSFVREFMMGAGISTNVQNNIGLVKGK